MSSSAARAAKSVINPAPTGTASLIQRVLSPLVCERMWPCPSTHWRPYQAMSATATQVASLAKMMTAGRKPSGSFWISIGIWTWSQRRMIAAAPRNTSHTRHQVATSSDQMIELLSA